jgi:PBP1b-binding outer membrane lipoprotein LpoB
MRLIRILGAILATGVVLSGCSSAGTQSGVQACSTFASSIQEWTNQLTSAATTAASDPSKAGASVEAVLTSVKAAREKVTNQGVAAALDKITSAGQSVIDTLNSSKGTLSQADQAKVKTATDDLRAALGELGTACTKL